LCSASSKPVTRCSTARTRHAQWALRTRNRVLDDHCGAIGRGPGPLVRVYFAGWTSGEVPFALRRRVPDFVGAYQDAGDQRFIFSFVSARRAYRGSEEDALHGARR
jgi:hypothetical protein